jgi:D-3-phosphoglycerate dehydrogenase / 2-oxoglutarate reductase
VKKCFVPTQNDDVISLLVDHDIKPIENWYHHRPSEEELISILEGCEAAIATMEPFSKRVLDSAPSLKLIAKIGVGYDNIDVDYATRKGLLVTFTPVPEQAKAMAEHTFALMLSFAKKVPNGNQEIRQGGWDALDVGEIQDIFGKTLGLLGVGRIGAQVAKRANAFDMDIIYHDVKRRPDLEDSIGIEYVSFEDLLSRSDFLSIHSPLNERTRGVIDARALSRMKRGSVLINTARGAIVDERALADALIEHRLAGACLDALSQEPPSVNHVFYNIGDRIPNLILTPHRGFSRDTSRIMEMAAANEVVSVLNGGRPRYPLNSGVPSTSS